jgi:hypothetical protein
VQIRKFTATLAAAALMTGAGVGIAQAKSSSQPGAGQTAREAADRRGPSDAQLETLADKLGVTTAELKAAMAATRPASGDRPQKGSMAADIAAALGADEAKVQAILEANSPATRPARPSAKPDQTALIAALASGLDIDEATVKTALDKLDAARETDHAARHAAMAAALAKQLGLKASDVQAALRRT